MLEQFTQIIREYKNDDTIVIDENTTLAGDLQLNSLDMLQLMLKAEDELNFDIPDKDLKNIKTVGDVIKYGKKRS